MTPTTKPLTCDLCLEEQANAKGGVYNHLSGCSDCFNLNVREMLCSYCHMPRKNHHGKFRLFPHSFPDMPYTHSTPKAEEASGNLPTKEGEGTGNLPKYRLTGIYRRLAWDGTTKIVFATMRCETTGEVWSDRLDTILDIAKANGYTVEGLDSFGGLNI